MQQENVRREEEESRSMTKAEQWQSFRVPVNAGSSCQADRRDEKRLEEEGRESNSKRRCEEQERRAEQA